MTNKLFLLLAVLILYSSIASANIDIGKYGVGDTVTILQSCSNCTFNNITSIIRTGQPPATVLAGEVAMTKTGTLYTYLFSNNTQNGIYLVNGYGDLDGSIRVWSYRYTVGGSLWVFMALVFAGIFVLGIAFIMGNEYIGFIAGALFVVSGVYAMINGLAEVGNDFTRMLAIVILGIGLMFLIAVGYQIISDKKGDE